MTKSIGAIARWVEDRSIGTLANILYRCSMAITFVCEVSAITILAAISKDKLDDPEAWTAVWFFGVAGGIAWIVGRQCVDQVRRY